LSTSGRSKSENSVSQRNVSAQGDVVGRDKIEQHFHAVNPAGVVEELLKKLDIEVAKNEKVRETIETLAYYYNRRSTDGIDGLEEKLKKGNRASEIMFALEKKELFAKLLEKWALYASAQKILAYFLAKAEYEFNFNIHPHINDTKPSTINGLVTEKIVAPIVAECGSSVFAINHAVAMGIIYWLAEQCYVRWHS
jgi:hypothetical protein